MQYGMGIAKDNASVVTQEVLQKENDILRSSRKNKHFKFYFWQVVFPGVRSFVYIHIRTYE